MHALHGAARRTSAPLNTLDYPHYCTPVAYGSVHHANTCTCADCTHSDRSLNKAQSFTNDPKVAAALAELEPTLWRDREAGR